MKDKNMGLIRKRRKEAQIMIRDSWQKSEKYYAKGVLIEVRNGKGALREVYGSTKQASFMTLMFGDKPLFQLQGEEYFCPTCEKMIRSGYGLEQSEEFFQNKLNENVDNVSFLEAVEGIKPILGLLKSGYYIIVETRLYPTDGNGHLFCEIPDSHEYLPGTCMYYYGDLSWGENRPHFTAGTEPYEKLKEDRIEYYEKHPGARALAYYMDGYMTALIDGHHKAMAAARMHKDFDALVIIPCGKYRIRNDNGQYEAYIGRDTFRWSCNEYGLDWNLAEADGAAERFGEKEINQILYQIDKKQKNDVTKAFCELAAYYPTADEAAALDKTGENLEGRIQKILDGESFADVQYLIKALVILKHPRTLETADYLIHQEKYRDYRYLILKEMVKLEKTEKMEKWMLNTMIEFEDDSPEIRDLILDYL